MISMAYRLQRRRGHVALYLAEFKLVLRIVTYTIINKAVVVTKINVVMFYFHFRILLCTPVYYWCYMSSSPLEFTSP